MKKKTTAQQLSESTRESMETLLIQYNKFNQSRQIRPSEFSGITNGDAITHQGQAILIGSQLVTHQLLMAIINELENQRPKK